MEQTYQPVEELSKKQLTFYTEQFGLWSDHYIPYNEQLFTAKKFLNTFTNELSPTATATALVVATT